MRKIIIFIFALFILFCGSSFAAVYYVDAVNGDNSYTGGSADPWKTITYASTTSASGDTINVAGGTYDTTLGEVFPIDLGENRQYLAEVTGVATIEGINHVVDIDTDSVIDGFKIIGMEAAYTIGIDVDGYNVQIRNCIIEGTNVEEGYGINIGDNQGAYITSTEVSNVYAGIRMGEASPAYATTIEASTFHDCGQYGIYVANFEARVRIIQNFIYNCTLETNATGISLGRPNQGNRYVDVEQNTLVNNTRGIYLNNPSSTYATVKNNIICANQFPNDRADSLTGISVSGGSVSNSYNNLWNLFTDYSGDVLPAATDLRSYPCFVDPENYDFDLYGNSPSIGAGDGGVNIGAYTGAGSVLSPYNITAYVDFDNGTDDTSHGGGPGTNAYKTVTFANRYTVTTMNIATGTYSTTETIELCDAKTLVGPASSGTATLECTTSGSNVLEGHYNAAISLLDVEFTGSGYGIYITGANADINYSNIFGDSNGYGIYFQGYSGSGLNCGGTVATCEVYNTDYGIYLRGYTGTHSPVTIETSTIYSNDTANIDLRDWGNLVTVFRNTIRDATTGHGIYLDDGDNGGVTVNRNTIVNNRNNIYVNDSESDYVTIKNNIICGPPGLDRGPDYDNSSRYGIYVSSSTHTISNRYNDFWNNWDDLYNATAATSEITSYPLFENPGSNDFDLCVGSACLSGGDPGDGSPNIGAYDGSGETSPYRTTSYVDIAQGTDATTHGSGPGTDAYETITFANKYTLNTMNVATGNYPTSEAVELNENKHMVGDGSGSTTLECTTTNTSVLVLGKNITLEGISVEFPGTGYSGHGIYVIGANADIKNCSVYSTSGDDQGDGIHFTGDTDEGFETGGRVSTSEVFDCDNGIILYDFNSTTAVTVEGCTLRNNANSNLYISSWGSPVTVTRNIVRDAYEYGISGPVGYGIGISGMSSGSRYVLVDKNTLAGNLHGIYLASSSSTYVTLQNNIVVGGRAPDRRPDVYNGLYGIYLNSGSVTHTYNCVWNNLDDFSGLTADSSEITQYPEFEDPWNNDFDLYTGSPCIGTGTPEGTAPNMGSYQGSGVGASPYRSVSYVDIASGTDNVNNGGGVGADAYKTFSFANKYSTGTMNFGSGLYTEASTTELCVGKYIVGGTDSGGATLECSTSGYNALEMTRNSTTEIFGIKFYGGGRGIDINSENAHVRQATIYGNNNGVGIYFGGQQEAAEYSHETGGRISTCEVFNTDTGIYLYSYTDAEEEFGSAITIEGSTLYDNDLRNIYVLAWPAAVTIIKNIIRDCPSGNLSSMYAGLAIDDMQDSQPGSVTVDRNTIVKNLWGILCDHDDSDVTIIKNNIVSNKPDDGTPASGSYGVYANNSTIDNTYNDLYGNETDYSGASAGTGSIASNADFEDEANDDYELTSSSPCIDTGDPATELDPDGTRADMGALPYYHSLTVNLVAPDGGETWEVSSTQTITWETTGSPDTINLYYTSTEAVAYQVITSEVSDTGTYSWTIPNDPTTEALVQVEAKIGLVMATDESSSTFTISDDIAPTVSSITLRDRTTLTTQYTNDSTISVEASGVSGSPTQMLMSEEASFTGVSWASYANPTTFGVSSGDGTKEVYYKLRNGALTESSTVDASIIYDATAPSTPTLVTPGDGIETTDSTPLLTWEASSDSLSGVASYEITIDTTVATQGATTTYTSGGLADGLHTWEVRAKDNAQNWGSAPTAFTFTLVSVPTCESLILRDRTTDSTQYTNDSIISVDASNISGSPVEMMISGEASFDGVSWITIDNPTTFEVSSGDGTKEVYYKMRNALGGVSITFEASIIYDATAPGAPTLVTPGDASTITDNTPTLTWEAVTGDLSGIATYEITVDTTVVTQGATTTYTSGSLADGLHTWEVRAKDNAQNWGTAATAFTFTVDTTIPTVESLALKDTATASAQYTNKRTITVEATNVSGSPTEMMMSEEASFTGATWATYENPTTYEVTSGDATKEVYYKLKNALETLSITFEASIIYDATGPAAPTLVTLANGSATNDATPLLTWEAVTSDLSGIESYQFSLIGILLAVVTGPSYEVGSALDDGTYTWQARAKDNAQNWGSYATPFAFTVDTISPLVTVEAPNGGENIAGGSSYLISWEATDGGSGLASNPITLRYSTNSGSSWSLIAGGEANDGVYSWSVPSISSSTCRVSVEAEDSVGNIGSDMSDADFSIITGSPTVSAITLSDRTSGRTDYTNDTTVSLEASGVSGSPTQMIASENQDFSGASWLTYSISTTKALGSTEGTKTVYYKVRNVLLTQSSTVDASIILDTTAPTAPTLSSPADGTITNDTTPTLSWEASTDTLSGVASYEIVIDTTYATQGATVTYTSPALLDGLHTWEVRAEDNAGNWGSYSSEWEFIIDTVGPTVTVVSPEAGITIEGGSTYTIAWTVTDPYGLATDPITIYYSSDGGTSFSTVAADLSNTGEYSWSVPSANSTTCRDKVKAIDLAGNSTETSTGDFSIITDTEDPHIVVKIDALPIKSGDYISATSTLDVYYTDNLALDSSTLVLKIDDVAVAPSIVSSSDTEIHAQYTLSLDAGNDHSIAGEIKDTIGNTGSREYTDLQVTELGVTVVGAVVCLPTPFAPARDGTCNLAYNLNKDANVSLYMYGIGGEMVWHRKFVAGQNGAKAGYNQVAFTGVSDISGGHVANGIYPFKIIADGRAIGKGYVVVYN